MSDPEVQDMLNADVYGTDKDAGEAARRMLAIASPKETGVSYVYDGDRRRADMQLVARAYLAQAKRIEELEKALAVTVDDFEAAAEALETSDPAMANACRRAALENLSIADATMSALKGE